MALNRSKFLNAVADRAGAHRRDVEHVWESALTVIQEAVRKGEDVSISGFGKFKQRVTKARKAGLGKNPFTGETIKIAARPATKKPAFVPAKQFKEFVGGSVKSLPKRNTRPMSLVADGGAPAKKTAAKKAAPKKTAKKASKATKKTAKKPAKKASRRR